MDDDSIKKDQNQSSQSSDQPQTIYETVPESTTSAQGDLQPEEVAPDVTTPEQAFSSGPPDLSDDGPPIYEENRIKYVFIGGALIFFIVIFALLLKLLLGGGKGVSKKVNLIYWGLWEDNQIMDPLIKTYESKNPNVKIEYTKMSPQDYREKIIARSKNNQGPDIFRFHNTWIPEIQDVVSPLPSHIMSNQEFEKTFYPIQAKDLKVGKYYYGIPLEIDGLVLIYNNGLLKKAGISKAPSSWEEVLNDVDKLTVRDSSGNIVTAGIALGTANNVAHFSDILGMVLLLNGGDLKKIDEKSAIQALQFYRQFAEPTKVNTWDENMPNSINAFAQEKVAMIIAPSWELLNIKNINPDVDAKTAHVPIGPASSTPIGLTSYWVEGVSRNSKNQDEAWKFIKYLSEKDTMTKFYELASKLRRFGEPYSRVDLRSAIIQDPYIGEVVKQADNFQTLPVVTDTYDNGLNDELIKYLENAINATAQGVSYEEALATAKQGITQVFAKYKIQ